VQREIKVMEILKGHPAVIDLKATFEDQKVKGDSVQYSLV